MIRGTKITKLFLILIMILHPIFYFSMYSGDAEIHLVYAENAAGGHFFEFNLGEKSAGVTSPGYMLILTSFFKIFPESIVPLAVKLLNILCWYLLLYLVFVLSRRLIGNGFWAWTVTLIVSLMPGAVYNATTGMENGIFGALFLFWLYLVIRWDWLAVTETKAKRSLILGILLGILCWIRPEGFVLAILSFTFKALQSLWSPVGSKRPVLISLKHILTALIPFLLSTALYFGFLYSETGQFLPTSGISRIGIGGQESFRIGSLPVNLKFVKYLIYYFPLTISMILGFRGLLSRKRSGKPPVVYYAYPAATIIVFIILYSSILGAHHLSRYMIFLLPVMTMFSGLGAKSVSENWNWGRKTRTVVFTASMILLGTLFAGEIYLRYKSGSNYPAGELWRAMKAPGTRREFSDRMFDELGKPSKLPVSLAYQEVQIRYRLDQRFIIRSLDGRVDATLLNFVDAHGNYDHVGYVKARNVDFIMETPNYNRETNRWSLKDLTKLKIGESISLESLIFTRLRHGFKVGHSQGNYNLYRSRRAGGKSPAPAFTKAFTVSCRHYCRILS